MKQPLPGPGIVRCPEEELSLELRAIATSVAIKDRNAEKVEDEDLTANPAVLVVFVVWKRPSQWSTAKRWLIPREKQISGLANHKSFHLHCLPQVSPPPYFCSTRLHTTVCSLPLPAKAILPLIVALGSHLKGRVKKVTSLAGTAH